VYLNETEEKKKKKKLKRDQVVLLRMKIKHTIHFFFEMTLQQSLRFREDGKRSEGIRELLLDACEGRSLFMLDLVTGLHQLDELFWIKTIVEIEIVCKRCTSSHSLHNFQGINNGVERLLSSDDFPAKAAKHPHITLFEEFLVVECFRRENSLRQRSSFELWK
jgi:hypothetical protein